MFRVASTPSSCTPARAEKSTDQAFSSRCWRSTPATGRQPLSRAGHGLVNSRPYWIDHGFRCGGS